MLFSSFAIRHTRRAALALALILPLLAGARLSAAIPEPSSSASATDLQGLDPAFDPVKDSQAGRFVTRNGSDLMLDGQVFRFVSVNIPNYHILEDPAAPGSPAWHRVSAFEQLDACKAVRRLGGQAFRIYVPSVAGGKNPAPGLSHIFSDASGKISCNEELFQDLDRGLAIAASQGLRVIIPLVDNWNWFGGQDEWAALSSSGDFWNDPSPRRAFKSFVTWLLNRKNTLNGLAYKDDPTILCWELGNEIDKANPAWISEMAAWIKSQDKKHLVMDGSHKGVPDENLEDPNLDILTTHYTDEDAMDWSLWIRDAGKAYIYGEFQPRTAQSLGELASAVISSNASGMMAWSLRFHSSGGGFYYHQDFGGSSDSLQYPGFDSTKPQDERAIFDTLRKAAWAIRGLKTPAEPVPDAPLLLAPDASGGLNWQGSAGAWHYRLETSPSKTGPWTVAADKLLDAQVQQFKGTLVPRLPLYQLPATRTPAWYRLVAVNASGNSLPSEALFF